MLLVLRGEPDCERKDPAVCFVQRDIAAVGPHDIIHDVETEPFALCLKM